MTRRRWQWRRQPLCPSFAYSPSFGSQSTLPVASGHRWIGEMQQLTVSDDRAFVSQPPPRMCIQPDHTPHYCSSAHAGSTRRERVHSLWSREHKELKGGGDVRGGTKLWHQTSEHHVPWKRERKEIRSPLVRVSCGFRHGVFLQINQPSL